MRTGSDTLLCVVNFRSNTGYAWDFIEFIYARIADHLAAHGIRTLVAYPTIPEPPRTLTGSAACGIVLDASLNSLASLFATIELIRREKIRVVYFTDRPGWRWSYLFLRLAGVRRIIVHDHTSGERKRPEGLRRVAKWVLLRIPGVGADVVVAVSDYVARRQIDVGMIRPSRVVRVWNGLPVIETCLNRDHRAHHIFGLDVDRPLIVCACRASTEKGVVHLLRAFDRVIQAAGTGNRRPALVYLGGGPQFAELQSVREELMSRGDIILAGYRQDVGAILECADICVVPSVWQEAFSLSVLEAMARGRPVIATRVGGVPELIEHDENGLLVPPADEEALAQAIQALLNDPFRAARLGEAARWRVATRFTPEQQLNRLNALLEECFQFPREEVRGPSTNAAGVK